MLAEGKNAWMKLVDADGKLRHTINPLGTVTGRASSFGPNLQQVPATRAAFGAGAGSCFGCLMATSWLAQICLASSYGASLISS